MPLVRLSLRQNFVWTFAGNVVYAACQWGMLVALAKLGTPAMVGQFALGLAVCAPVIMFANLQLRAVQATDARGEYRFGHYLGLRLITTVVAFLVIAGIVAVAGYGPEAGLVILLIGLAKTFEALSDVFYGLLQQQERMDRIAKSMMLKGPLSLVALAVGVHLTGRVCWGVGGLALAWALILVSYDLRSGALILKATSSAMTPLTSGATEVGQRIAPYWEIRTIARLAWLALPLGAVMMLISLNTNLPRLFIEHYLGERSLGIFAAMAYLMVVGSMVVRALGQSVSPRLAQHYARGEGAAFYRLLLKVVSIGALLGVGGVLVVRVAGRQILTLLYRPEYAERAEVLQWIMVAAAISYIASFLGYAMTAARYFKVQLPLFALVTASSAAACWGLIPAHGLLGAAWALVIAAVVQVSGSAAVVMYALHKLYCDRS